MITEDFRINTHRKIEVVGIASIGARFFSIHVVIFNVFLLLFNYVRSLVSIKIKVFPVLLRNESKSAHPTSSSRPCDWFVDSKLGK
jgi:hypothetical protein